MVQKYINLKAENSRVGELICDLQSWFDSLDWRPLKRTPGDDVWDR